MLFLMLIVERYALSTFSLCHYLNEHKIIVELNSVLLFLYRKVLFRDIYPSPISIFAGADYRGQYCSWNDSFHCPYSSGSVRYVLGVR